MEFSLHCAQVIISRHNGNNQIVAKTVAPFSSFFVVSSSKAPEGRNNKNPFLLFAGPTKTNAGIEKNSTLKAILIKTQPG